MRGEQPTLIPVVNQDPHGMAAVPGLAAHTYFEGSRHKAPAWVNQVTLKTYFLM